MALTSNNSVTVKTYVIPKGFDGRVLVSLPKSWVEQQDFKVGDKIRFDHNAGTGHLVVRKEVVDPDKK